MSDSSISAQRSSGGTAEVDSKNLTDDNGGCSLTPCCAFLSQRDLSIVQNVGKALRDGYARQGVPAILELTDMGFNIRIGDPLNVSLVIGGLDKPNGPEIHVGAYDPSINREATRAIFANQ